MPLRRPLLLSALLWVLAFGNPAASVAQDMPISIAAARYLQGRFEMPVTCRRTDGTLVETSETIVIKPAVNQDGHRTVRVTFFGILGDELEHCFNLVRPTVPDRRGILYVTYNSVNPRPDIGIKDFKRDVERGPLEYVITGGKLRIALPGKASDPAREVRFRDGDSLRVSVVRGGSDADKVLGVAERIGKRPGRKLEFRITGSDDFELEAFYREDDPRQR